MASDEERFPTNDGDRMELRLSITRGAPRTKKKFKGTNRKVTHDRIVKRSGRDGKMKTLRANQDGSVVPLWYGGSKIDSTVQGQFRIPKYEPWHRKSQPPNPYDQYFFPVMQDGLLGLTLEECESWNHVRGSARTMEYNTEHVFEVQQLKGFFGDLIRHGWMSGNHDMVNIVFDPQCHPVQSWPFYRSNLTSVAQLLANFLPNHKSGILNHDFVYLEARVNKMKGGYSYNRIPKALTGSTGELLSGLIQLKEVWSALRTTMLVLQYLNNNSVVSKYNHVSRRKRRMLEEIARQSREDRLQPQQWPLWSSWEPLAASEELVKIFNTSETTFLQEVELRIRRAVHNGLTRIANFQPKNREEGMFHEWCKQRLQSETSTKTPQSFGLGLHKLSQTREEREDWKLHSELGAHVSQTELGKTESMEDIHIEDANEDRMGSVLEVKKSSGDWAANNIYENGLPILDSNDSDRDF